MKYSIMPLTETLCPSRPVLPSVLAKDTSVLINRLTREGGQL